MYRRWTLFDQALAEAWTFPVNPNKMTSPHGPRSLTILSTAPTNTTSSSHGRVVEGNMEPYEWQFSGSIRTQEHHDELRRWTRKVNRLMLTDHFDRTWWVRFTGFEVDEKRPSTHTDWRFDYTIKAINYGSAA